MTSWQSDETTNLMKRLYKSSEYNHSFSGIVTKIMDIPNDELIQRVTLWSYNTKSIHTKVLLHHTKVFWPLTPIMCLLSVALNEH